MRLILAFSLVAAASHSAHGDGFSLGSRAFLIQEEELGYVEGRLFQLNALHWINDKLKELRLPRFKLDVREVTAPSLSFVFPDGLGMENRDPDLPESIDIGPESSADWVSKPLTATSRFFIPRIGDEFTVECFYTLDPKLAEYRECYIMATYVRDDSILLSGTLYDPNPLTEYLDQVPRIVAIMREITVCLDVTDAPKGVSREEQVASARACVAKID